MLHVADECGCKREIGMTKAREPQHCEHGNLFRYAKALGRSGPASGSEGSSSRKASQRPRRSGLKRSSKASAVPRWLTGGFALGVDQREAAEAARRADPYGCWLCQFDPEERDCTDTLERCHVINRQRVEKAVDAMLDGAWIEDPDGYPIELSRDDRFLFVQYAAWDPRNARLGCTGHHPRFDSNATPRLYVPFDALPGHVLEFTEDWGLELELARKCPRSTQTESPIKQGAAAPEREQ